MNIHASKLNSFITIPNLEVVVHSHIFAITECFLTADQVNEYTLMIGATLIEDATAYQSCSLDGNVWSMTLTCPGDKVWGDTQTVQRTYTCACNGGAWQPPAATVTCVLLHGM